jgi:D-galacturonate reductase
MSGGVDALIVGGGMITADQILPSLYHLQRLGAIRQLSVCATRSSSLRALAANPALEAAFPGSSFTPWPDLARPDGQGQPQLYRNALAAMKPRQLVVVAVPDHLHHEAVMAALRSDQHVLCVKPLVLKHCQASEIAAEARERGLFVGVEYHKRFDRRSLLAREGYLAGRFGEMVMAEARLLEPYRYRNSNFQRWFTVDQTDPFTYIGCHYVDLVRFITGLLPVEVSVVGIRGRFPSGTEGFLWSQGRVWWENGALLSVINGLGYPDNAAGSNDQGLTLYCEGPQGAGMIRHDDHYRGVSHAYIDPQGTSFRYVSPDYFQLVPWEGEGLRPVGYGFDSIEAIVRAVLAVEKASDDLPPKAALEERRRQAAEADGKGLIATPANSAAVDLVVEAGRLSIMAGGAPVRIRHGAEPKVELRR